jgi:hypothetical protein
MIDAWIEDAIPVDVAKDLRVGVGPMPLIHCARECRGLPPGPFFRLAGSLVAGVLRKLPRCPPGSTNLDSSGRFFFAPQCPLETASVHFDRKLFLNSLDTGDGRQTRIGCAQVAHKLDDLLGKLVSFLGSTTFWKQTTQASLFERQLSLVNGGTRNAEVGRYVDDRVPLDAVPTQHLVADLKKILGVEEWILVEQCVGYAGGMRV